MRLLHDFGCLLVIITNIRLNYKKIISEACRLSYTSQTAESSNSRYLSSYLNLIGWLVGLPPTVFTFEPKVARPTPCRTNAALQELAGSRGKKIKK